MANRRGRKHVPDPTPEEIAERAAEIRKEWAEKFHDSERKQQDWTPYLPKTYRVSKR